MNITDLLFQWREKFMISIRENFKRTISMKIFNFVFTMFQLYAYLFSWSTLKL